jgi:GLPGLI family protein
MKLIISIFLVSLVISQTINGQKKENALLLTKYKIIHIYDTTNRDKPGEEVMQLLISKNGSEFSSYDFEIEYSNYHKARWEEIGPDGTIHRGSNYPPNYMNKSRMIQYNFTNPSKSYSVYNLVYQLYFGYDFKLPKIDWKISEDTLRINDILCQKATAFVKGRTYNVWFAPTLPFSTGPWKLHGLPGLILEASDEKKEVQFKFISIQNVSNQERILQLPPKTIQTSKEKFDALMTAAKRNPWILGKFVGMTDQMAEQFLKDNAEMIAKQRLSNMKQKSVDINNPIELTEE